MSRYCIIFSIIALMTLNSAGQEYKDKFMINASIGGYSINRLDNDDYDGDKHIPEGSYYLNLKGGYFISNKSLFGISSGYIYDQETDYPHSYDTVRVTSTNKSFDIGPFYKGYFKLVKSFYFTLNISPFYRYSSLKKSYPDEEFDPYYSYKENSIYISVLPGLSFELNDKISIEFELGFYNAYVKFRKVLDSPLSVEERKQFVYGTSTSLNEFSINNCLIGFTYRFNCN
jgi:hypothetical protein